MILAWDGCLSAISRGEKKRKDRYDEERKSHVDLDTPRRERSIRHNVGMSLFAYPMRMRQGLPCNVLARPFFGGMRTDFTPKSPERLSSWVD